MGPGEEWTTTTGPMPPAAPLYEVSALGLGHRLQDDLNIALDDMITMTSHSPQRKPSDFCTTWYSQTVSSPEQVLSWYLDRSRLDLLRMQDADKPLTAELSPVS